MGKLAITRPVTITMITLFYVLLGIAAYFFVPRDLFPRITRPSLRVVTKYQGASSKDIEEQITRKLEEALAGVKGITRLNSRSGEEKSEITLEFDFDVDLDFASIEVREKLDQVESELPAEAKKTIIERWNASAQPIIVANISTRYARAIDLRRHLKNTVKVELERISGVASVKIEGGDIYEVALDIDGDKLTRLHLSLEDIENAFKRENVSLRGGQLVDGYSELLVRTAGKATNLRDIENIVVARRPESIRLVDLLKKRPASKSRAIVLPQKITSMARLQANLRSFSANVDFAKELDREKIPDDLQKSFSANGWSLSHEAIVKVENPGTQWLVKDPEKNREYFVEKEKGEIHVRLRPQESVQISIFKKPDSDTLKICDKAREIFDKYCDVQRATIRDLAVTITSDQSRYIRQSLNNIGYSAIFGIFLAIIVLLVFLRNVESTVIIALSMPISIVASFSLFYGIGMGLNLFSMAGLTLAVGMVVDNAIVVIESVFANRQTQRRLDRAITFSLTEVGPPIFSSTLTTLAVFIPLLFVKGFIGQVFRDLSCTIVFTLLFSLLVAFTVIPMLLYRLLGTSFGPAKTLNRFFDRVIGALFSRVARSFMNGYSRLMSAILRNWSRRGCIIFATGMVLALSFLAMPASELLPEIISKELVVKVQCPMALSLREKDAIARQVENVLAKQPLIKRFATTVSAELSFSILLNRCAPEILPVLHKEIEKIPDVRNVDVSAVSPLAAIFSESGKDISIQVLGPDFAVLEKTTAEVEKCLKTDDRLTGLLTDVENSMSEKKLEMSILVDKKQASARKASTASIAREVATAVAGRKVGDVVLSKWGRLDVKLSLAISAGANVLDNIPIKGAQATFPLKKVATIREIEGPVSIYREERQRAGLVLANINKESGAVLGSVGELLVGHGKILDKIKTPPGYRIHLVGRSKAMKKSFASLIFAMIAAIVLVYMIMAAQFESLLHPFAIMFSLPLAGIGAIWALRICGMNLSTPAFIGLIMLAGIVVNNAIILIDYINILRARGLDRDKAVLAAGKARMRPIFMTTTTTVTGMLPMALASGAGASLYQPLAIVVIGGLSLATLLTLIFIPTIYCFFDDIREFVDFALLKFSLAFKGIEK